MSQYKSQLLSILGYPVPEKIPMVVSAAIMLNILGGINADSHQGILNEAIVTSNAALHMYGKEPKPGRKIGHITLLHESMPAAEHAISNLITLTDTLRAERKCTTAVAQPSMKSIPRTPTQGTQPLIAITMGSDSDLPVLKPGLAILKALGIPYHVTITSAHRTPALMTTFARTAASKGYRVIIASAGGAAHLPGMIAAMTPLPVIGLPVKGSSLEGMDSLLSQVQMPRGVPVATVAINNGVNAALLAVRILGSGVAQIRERMERYMAEQEEVLGKAERLNEAGWETHPGEKK
jgi:phosphoribosylaminoimidazole carboxylase